ncbi:CU044_5270 family protein [Dactylosporangium sp. NPDC048998]|uniref:CU044_5270 family protein n=1 Tax=Dactylosporangium sp. NPDC048998 TaxID=3363976 RepID=UPI003713205A
MSRDTMRTLAEARPGRLAPSAPPADPAMIMSYPREAVRAPRPTLSPTRRLVLAGAGLATVAAVTAAVALQQTAPTTPKQGISTAAAPDPETAADLLLVAATRSDAGPAGGGRYWVVRAEHGEQRDTGLPRATDEQWLATRPGDPSVAYLRGPSGGWTLRPLQGHTAENNFLLGGRPRSAAELAALPSRPEELKAKLLQWYAESGATESRDGFLFFSGAAIVLDLPVPAPVRAAAYRLLAELPGIASLGRVTDALGRSGIAVAYTRRGDGGAEGQQRLIVDPATGNALAQESWTAGARLSYTAVVKAQWSDATPPNAADVH